MAACLRRRGLPHEGRAHARVRALDWFVAAMMLEFMARFALGAR